ncbi:helix-turn-helix transcriptional regulator [Nostocales cyanobacterium LEGE 11386]|nr:helix-turn-helix transcriptional regulator [Nostocales cyanobacterium LEGE 11386]
MNLEDAIIVPAHIESSARWDRSHSYLALCLDPITLEQKLSSLVKGYSVELSPQFALSDALLRNVGLALKAELEKPGFAGQLYIDSLLNTLAVHLLRHYCVQKSLSSQISRLPQTKLNQVLDYIQSHLAQDLTLAELAAIAQVSPNYFATQFKHSVGIAPHQYVIQQRIERAKLLMTTGKDSIAEISGSVGFADQSHFTRHFKRLVGVTPKRFLTHQ